MQIFMWKHNFSSNTWTNNTLKVKFLSTVDGEVFWGEECKHCGCWCVSCLNRRPPVVAVISSVRPQTTAHHHGAQQPGAQPGTVPGTQRDGALQGHHQLHWPHLQQLPSLRRQPPLQLQPHLRLWGVHPAGLPDRQHQCVHFFFRSRLHRGGHLRLPGCPGFQQVSITSCCMSIDWNYNFTHCDDWFLFVSYCYCFYVVRMCELTLSFSVMGWIKHSVLCIFLYSECS